MIFPGKRRTRKSSAAALSERETLLGEIHHRVKNNLAVINSLLNLQMGKTPEKGVRSVLRDCQSRIKSMALIHESLYQAKGFLQLHLKEYVSRLANVLLNAYRVSSDGVRLNLDIDKDILLPTDCMVPCGLVLNELISNSLKYAFPPLSTGEITIKGRDLGRRRLELDVSDNGIGIPEEIDIRKTGNTGTAIGGQPGRATAQGLAGCEPEPGNLLPHTVRPGKI